MANTATHAQETVGKVADKAKDAVASGADKAKDLAAGAADKAKDIAAGAGKMADQATSSVGSGIESLGQTIREAAPKEGVLHTAAETVASGLESSGKYLSEEGLSGIASDVTEAIKKNPVAAVFIAVGIGYLLARATRS